MVCNYFPVNNSFASKVDSIDPISAYMVCSMYLVLLLVCTHHAYVNHMLDVQPSLHIMLSSSVFMSDLTLDIETAVNVLDI